MPSFCAFILGVRCASPPGLSINSTRRRLSGVGYRSSPRVDRRHCRGLTLIEVLLVLAILVIIASLAVTAYGPIQRKAYMRAAEAQIKAFKTPLQAYYLDLNCYPTTQQGLEALRSPPGDLPNPAKWNGPYLDSEVPLDPWGRPYQYECPGRYNPDTYDLWSLGPDGQNGTDDDIGNWMVE